jgi:hypothetical protein
MKILAVLAVASNVATELHYRQVTSFRLPEDIAPVVSHLAAASACVFVTGAVLGLMLYLNEHRSK